MAVGTLIAESLQVDAVIDGVRLVVTKIARADVGDVAAGQPRTWTFIEFEVSDEDVDALARSLETALRREGGWYCDFRTEAETFVVFAGRTFRYARVTRQDAPTPRTTAARSACRARSSTGLGNSFPSEPPGKSGARCQSSSGRLRNAVTRSRAVCEASANTS